MEGFQDAALLHHYKATVKKSEGYHAIADIDLGFDLSMENIHLFGKGIDAFQVGEPAIIHACDFVSPHSWAVEGWSGNATCKVESKLYHYMCWPVSVYDGDTLTARIALVPPLFVAKGKLRLDGIDTPEVRGEEREKGLISKAHLIELVGGKPMLLHSLKKGKYGRYIADLWNAGGVNIPSKMVEDNMAIRREY